MLKKTRKYLFVCVCAKLFKYRSIVHWNRLHFNWMVWKLENVTSAHTFPETIFPNESKSKNNNNRIGFFFVFGCTCKMCHVEIIELNAYLWPILNRKIVENEEERQKKGAKAQCSLSLALMPTDTGGTVVTGEPSECWKKGMPLTN